MKGEAAGFVHEYVAGDSPHTTCLLLLHGTGGSEEDLLSTGAAVAPGAPLLAPRGRVSENGNARFFRRLAEGVLDTQDLILRVGELATFVAEARHAYGLGAHRFVALGLSNGANTAAGLMLLHPGVLDGAILLRAMVPLTPGAPVDLKGKKIFMSHGSADETITQGEPDRLADVFSSAGAEVERHTEPVGHRLSRGDVDAAAAWFARHYAPA